MPKFLKFRGVKPVKKMDNPHHYTFLTHQFRKDKFLFDFPKPRLFGQSQCEHFQKFYVLYRLCYVLIWLTLFIYDMVTKEDKSFWSMYLSIWNHMLLMVCPILQFTMAIHYHQQEQKLTVMPIIYKISWIVYTISTNVALCVTVVFLANLFPNTEDHSNVMSVAWHLLNYILIFVDIFICGIPIRIYHFYLVTGYGFVYGFFSVIIWASGGGRVYTMLDWHSNGGMSAGLLFLVPLVGAPVAQFFLFILFWIRVLLYGYICKLAGLKIEEVVVVEVDSIEQIKQEIAEIEVEEIVELEEQLPEPAEPEEEEQGVWYTFMSFFKPSENKDLKFDDRISRI